MELWNVEYNMNVCVKIRTCFDRVHGTACQILSHFKILECFAKKI